MHFLHRLIGLLAVVLVSGAAPSSLYAQKAPLSLARSLQRETLYFMPARPVLPAHSGLLSPRFWIGIQTSASKIPVERVVLSQLIQSPVSQKHTFPGKKAIDAVIFDLDGTLLDSLPAWDHSGTNFLRTQGIIPPAGLDEELAKMSLMDGARLLKQMFNLPQSPEEILRLTLEPIRQHYYHDILPKPGVRKLLKNLHDQGIKLSVATASDRDLAEAALKRTGLLDYFDFIITCDEVGVGKRNPAVYQAARQKLGTALTRTLVVEDALYALQTAKKAGFLTAGIFDVHSVKDQPILQHTADFYILSFDRCHFQK